MRLPPAAESTRPPPAQVLVPVPLAGKIGTLAAIILPFLGIVAAIIAMWGWGVTWLDLGLLFGLYLVTAIGITVGFHRLFVHRAFETYNSIKVVLAALGSMAVLGSLQNWVAQHRRHHQHSDTTSDPHSPHHQGRGFWGRTWGLIHAHIGWAFKPDPSGLARYAQDVQRSRALRVVSALFPVWIILTLLIPAALGGLLSGSWAGVLTGLIWGGLVRIFLVHHVTWSVNSLGHFWGTQPFRSDDHSRNNYLIGILALGEGWHNSHHAFPTSARHGLRWWEPDVSYYVIRGMALLGLAWNIKLPSREAQQRERRLA